MAISEKDRNARLDELKKSVLSWYEKETKRLQQQVEMSKGILKGRTGADRLTSNAFQETSNLVADSIGQFLSGELHVRPRQTSTNVDTTKPTGISAPTTNTA